MSYILKCPIPDIKYFPSLIGYSESERTHWSSMVLTVGMNDNVYCKQSAMELSADELPLIVWDLFKEK